MKRVCICLSFMLLAVLSFAQTDIVGFPLTVAEAGYDGNNYTVFFYRDSADSLGYYLALGTVDKISGSPVVFEQFSQTCICLGTTMTEADSTLRFLMGYLQEEPGTTMDCRARLAVGPTLMEWVPCSCRVEKRIFGIRRLDFSMRTPAYTTMTYLRKGAIKNLLKSLEFYMKYHPEE